MAGERFPDVDWYCDRCNAYLNDQYGFNDQKGVWKCTECGYISSISRDNILPKNYTLIDNSLMVVDLLRVICLHVLMLFFVLTSFEKQVPILDKYIVYIAAMYPALVLIRLFVIIYGNYKVGYIAQIFGTIVEDVFLPYKEVLTGKAINNAIFAKDVFKKIICIVYLLICGFIICAELFTLYNICVATCGSLPGAVSSLLHWISMLTDVRALYYPFMFFVFVMQILSFVTFGIDKYYAKNDKWRIKESTLFVFCILFGGIGGFLAMRFFRHKIRKPGFRIVVPMLALLQIVIIIWISLQYFR